MAQTPWQPSLTGSLFSQVFRNINNRRGAAAKFLWLEFKAGQRQDPGRKWCQQQINGEPSLKQLESLTTAGSGGAAPSSTRHTLHQDRERCVQNQNTNRFLTESSGPQPEHRPVPLRGVAVYVQEVTCQCAVYLFDPDGVGT